MIGTDTEILGSKPTFTINKGVGRPALDRNLVKRYLDAGYSPAQIATEMECKVRTVRKVRRELERVGDLRKEDRDIHGKMVALDFDDECKRAMGYSFREWLINKKKEENARWLFNFCERIWRVIWNRPSLFRAADRTDQTGDQLAQTFLTKFSEDKTRIRNRKKKIRQLFTFLGRSDINERP